MSVPFCRANFRPLPPFSSRPSSSPDYVGRVSTFIFFDGRYPFDHMLLLPPPPGSLALWFLPRFFGAVNAFFSTTWSAASEIFVPRSGSLSLFSPFFHRLFHHATQTPQFSPSRTSSVNSNVWTKRVVLAPLEINQDVFPSPGIFSRPLLRRVLFAADGDQHPCDLRPDPLSSRTSSSLSPFTLRLLKFFLAESCCPITGFQAFCSTPLLAVSFALR